jgi:hypothetical protein
MATFSQRNVPHAPAGAKIPSGARRALLSWFDDHQVAVNTIWRTLRQRVGYGEPQDVIDDVLARFGADAADPDYVTVSVARTSRAWSASVAGALRPRRM